MESEPLSALSSTSDTAILSWNLDVSFIHDGGHSLTAAALVSACKESGCHLTSNSVPRQSIHQGTGSLGTTDTRQRTPA